MKQEEAKEDSFVKVCDKEPEYKEDPLMEL